MFEVKNAHYISLNLLETMKLQRNAPATIIKQMIVHHTGTLISNCTRSKIVIAKNTAPTICIKSNILP